MKRLFDIILALIAAAVLLVPFVLLWLAVRLTSRGPALFWSDRIGQHNALFKMPKFRSMHVGTLVVATHLMSNPMNYLTPIGSFLRKSSLDELPQLWSVLRGDMSFVGPRPALFNQYDLIKLRAVSGIHRLKPGLTGWAQVNGRDNLTIKEKVAFDKEYMTKKSFVFDLKILYLTFIKIIRREGIRH
jgi:O-antigen biosynthesis protein WbqP